MKNSLIKTVLVAFFCVFLFSAFKTGNRVKIFMIGDSTKANKDISGGKHERGWGMMLKNFFTEDVIIDNHAVNGRSSKSFITEGRWQKVLDKITPGDYVFIQFGHNDEKVKEGRGADAWHAYRVNLIYMAEEFRKKGVRAIFITSIARRRFEDGLLVDTHGDWPAAMKAAAYDASVDCIDMTIPTMIGIMARGEEESKDYFMNFGPGLYENYPEGNEDDTHLRPEGAEWTASLIFDALSMLPKRPEFII